MIEETSRPEEAETLLLEDETADAGGIDLLALAIAFISQWRLALSVAAIVAIFGIGYVLHLKPLYVATATILPQEGRSSETLASAFFNVRGPGTLYIGLMSSRSVQDLVIDRANLLQIYHLSDREAARGMLTGISKFTETGDGLLTISVRDGDANRAALIANAYLDALQALNEDMGLQQSTRTRSFFETQLTQERGQLAQAEDRYRQMQKKTGLVQPEAQISSGIATIQTTRQQIQTLEVQRAAKLRSETEQNPEIMQIDAQLAQLAEQERTQESAGSGAPVGAAPSAQQALSQSLELQRAQRDVTYYSALVASLGNEFETARLNEIAGRSAFQVVDRAIPPEKKDWPPRKPYFAVSLAFAVLMAIVAVVLRLVILRIKAHAKTRSHLQALRRALR